MQMDFIQAAGGGDNGKPVPRARRPARPDTTIDWVQQETGAARIMLCERDGHDWYIAGPIDMVQEVPAAPLRCTRCDKGQYSWIPKRLLRKGGLVL